jgi:hypothetical protein
VDSKSDGEEVLLLVLERCALGTRLVDMQMKYRRNHAALGRAIHIFADGCKNVGATSYTIILSFGSRT